MTKRLTPATTTAIGVITVSLLAAGGSRLFVPWHVAAAADTIAGTIAIDKAALPADGVSTATVTVSNSDCGTLIGIDSGSALVQADNGATFSASQTGPFTATVTVPLGTGRARVWVRATSTPGLQNVWASFSPSLLAANCTGQTANAQFTELGTAASVTLDAPAPARLQVSTPTTKAHVVAHVLDASSGPVPGDKVFLVRNGDPASAVAMTDTGGGTYTADVAPAAAPRSESLIAVDTSTNPNLLSPAQTLSSVSSNADCTHVGLKFAPTGITADGTSISTASTTFFNGTAPAAGEPVSFTADPGLNITGASAATDASGVATATIHAGYAVGTKKVTVTSPNSLISCSQTVAISNGTAGTKDSGQLSRFIYRAYNDVLHRVGEDPGVEYFGNFLTFGGSRGQVALTFTTTTEYLTNLVNATYQTYLGRGGDPGGVSYWVGQLENGGTTDEQLAALFISSDEFYATHGGTDGGWVDGLYHVVLGRAPDAPGRQNWLDALQHGWSRTQVAYFFTGSTEQLNNKVIGYFSTFLHRGPGSIDDVNYWVHAMQNGVHDENVMAAFIGSQEYYDKS